MKPKLQANILPPMLAPNKVLQLDIPLSTVVWPKSVSIKYNGRRGLAMNNMWVSRSGKYIHMCAEVKERFAPILEDSDNNGIVRDGEFNSTTHNTVGETGSILAGTIPMPDDFKFKCFYEIPYKFWNGPVGVKLENCIPYPSNLPRYEAVKQTTLHSLEEFERLIEESKRLNLEGFMLIDLNSFYAHRRCDRVGEQVIQKFKYYSDPEDAKVVGVTPRQERANPGIVKRDSFGYSEQPYTQDSFVDTDVAGCIKAELETGEVIHAPFPVGWTIEMRQQAYRHFGTGSPHDIEGEWICFRRLNCENRGKPISIKGVEFRDSKD